MSGSSERALTKRCPLCGGTLSDGLTTIPFLVENRVAVIRDVPAELCGDCGEAYMKGTVVDRVEAVLDTLEKLHAEVSVVHYEAA